MSQLNSLSLESGLGPAGAAGPNINQERNNNISVGISLLLLLLSTCSNRRWGFLLIQSMHSYNMWRKKTAMPPGSAGILLEVTTLHKTNFIHLSVRKYFIWEAGDINGCLKSRSLLFFFYKFFWQFPEFNQNKFFIYLHKIVRNISP